jgi:NTE family protein
MRRLLAGMLIVPIALALLSGLGWVPTIIDNPDWSPPTGPMEFGGGYRLSDFPGDPHAQVFTALAFSGGGKRSAAFAHGVLRGLRGIPVRTTIGSYVSLLDEVDYIAAVSGGSFAAMHYGLYRERSFETFMAFLHEDINAYVWGLYLFPWHWVWLLRDGGTNDYMAEIYDRLIFHGATYADLGKRGAPVISIDATDIATGGSFPFTQESFDLICANLAPFPLARAVAASNGFPLLFSPITLPNHRPGCPPVSVPPPPLNATPDEVRRLGLLQEWANQYADPAQVRYVHLLDGGIADNLALRPLLNIVLTSKLNALPRSKIGSMRRVLMISVDGEATADPKLSMVRHVEGLAALAATVSGIAIDRYNADTIMMAESELHRLVQRLRNARCEQGAVVEGHACDDVEGAFVHLSLARITDPTLRARLQAIPTGLTIAAEDVDLLVSWGERLVREDPNIRRLLAGL